MAMNTLISHHVFGGGEDRVTPPFEVPAGKLLRSQNYEAGITGYGYRRFGGYERYDGRPLPSTAQYATLTYDTGTNAPVAGTTVLHGASSGARGLVTSFTVAEGDWATNDATGVLTLAVISGSFVTAEALQGFGGSPTYATSTGNMSTALLSGAQHVAAETAAREGMRGIITAVPGSGAILGVWVYAGLVRAFRSHMVLSFDAGQNEPAVGDVLTGVTSADTATIVWTHVESGDWATNDAAGYFVIDGAAAGDFTDSETLQIAGPVTVADAVLVAELRPCLWTESLDGWLIEDTPLFAAGGSFEFVNYNFGGHAGTVKMYGVDGVSKAFEFDGTTLAFITTGMATDAPTHLAARRNALYLSFSGGSVQNSPVGDPTAAWSVVTGAGEFGLGDEVTGMVVLRDDSLMVGTRDRIKLITGSPGLSDTELIDFSTNLGVLPNTLADAVTPVFADRIGLVVFSSTLGSSLWSRDTVSQGVSDVLPGKLSSASAAVVSRELNLYRLFFSDKTAMSVALGGPGGVAGITSLRFLHTIECACSGEDAGGNEIVCFGSDNGFVYVMDSGTSFDGSAVPAFIRTVYDYQSDNGLDPYRIKRYHKVNLQVRALPGATFQVTPIFDWGAGDKARHPAKTVTVSGGSGWILGVGVLGTAFLGGSDVPLGACYVEGTGSSIGLFISSNSATEAQHELLGVSVEFSVQGREG